MIYVIIGAFITLDIVSGITKALKQNALSSKIMRLGFLHKFSYVIILALCWLIDFGSQYLDMNFPLNLFYAGAVFVCTTETLSIIENILQVLPENIGAGIRSLFHLPQREVTDNDSESV